MSDRLRMTILAAAIASTAIVAGCGDNEDSSSASQSGDRTIATSSLDKEAYIKKAEAACEREGKGAIGELESYLNKHSQDGLPQDKLLANAFKATLLPLVEAQIAAIRKLGAPAGDEEEIEALLAAQQEAVDEAQKAKNLNSTGDFEKHFIEATKEFESYGFGACAIADRT